MGTVQRAEPPLTRLELSSLPIRMETPIASDESTTTGRSLSPSPFSVQLLTECSAQLEQEGRRRQQHGWKLLEGGQGKWRAFFPFRIVSCFVSVSTRYEDGSRTYPPASRGRKKRPRGEFFLDFWGGLRSKLYLLCDPMESRSTMRKSTEKETEKVRDGTVPVQQKMD
ncbi:hypothetical protein NL676_006649 [Syzygium grande]|nr:hypothetical protein NL676_006649 [Syzygium grande]